MSQQAVDRKIFIDDYLDLKTVDVTDWSPVLQLRPKGVTVDEVYRALHGRYPASLTALEAVSLASPLLLERAAPLRYALAADGRTFQLGTGAEIQTSQSSGGTPR